MAEWEKGIKHSEENQMMCKKNLYRCEKRRDLICGCGLTCGTWEGGLEGERDPSQIRLMMVFDIGGTAGEGLEMGGTLC